MARKKIQPELTNLFGFYERFPDEKSCREYLLHERFPDGKVECAKCEKTDKIYSLADGKRYKCGNCKHIFTITVGTIFEQSHISLHKWFLAIYIVSAHKKGISSLQLHRDIGVTQRTAWFMLHRIRHMLGNGVGKKKMKGTVEADETYIGGKPRLGDGKLKRGRGSEKKTAVFGMIERGGEVVAYPVERVNKATLQGGINRRVAKGSKLMTDEWAAYTGLEGNYKHEIVNHGTKEYARGHAHVNNMENFWSMLKRGIFGIYHVVSPAHLARYCDEFAYRANTREMLDAKRFKHSFSLCEGRLKYKELIAE